MFSEWLDNIYIWFGFIAIIPRIIKMGSFQSIYSIPSPTRTAVKATYDQQMNLFHLHNISVYTPKTSHIIHLLHSRMIKLYYYWFSLPKCRSILITINWIDFFVALLSHLLSSSPLSCLSVSPTESDCKRI